MATKLYFRSSPRSDWGTGHNDAKLDTTAGTWDNWTLSTTAGTSTTTPSTTTVAGPTNGVEVASGGVPQVWYSAPLDADVTISGSITWNLWASEVNMADNVAINGRLEVVDGATGTITLIDQTARIVEVAQTTRTVNNFAETPASGVACKRGDRLRVRVFGDDLGATAMGAGGSFTFGYDDTAAALADSWLQLTENLTFVSEPAGTTIYPTDTGYTPATETAATLLTSFTGADETPLSEGGTWSALSSSFTGLSRLSNQVGPSAASNKGSYYNVQNYGPDIEAYVTVVVVPATSVGYLLARVQGEGGANTWDGYAVQFNTTSSLRLLRQDNAAGSFIGRDSGVIVANGDKIGIACHGDSIQAWHQPSGGGSWRLVDQATDATYSSAGKIALLHTGVASSATRFDDLYVVTSSFGTFDTYGTGREAWTSRGAGVQTDVTNTAAGWVAPIQVTDTAGGTVVDWFSKQLTAFTLGGAVRVNVRAAQSVSFGAVMRCEVARVASDGTSPTVWGATTWGRNNGNDLTTTEAAASFLVGGDDLAITNGQRLRIRFYLDNNSSAVMTTGRTVTLYYAGTSGGASGDTYLTFTQTLTEFSAGTTANAITATATGSAPGGADVIVATPVTSMATGTANNPTAVGGISTITDAAAATGAAYNATVTAVSSVSATTQLAAGTGAALNVSTKVTANLGVATATGSAADADMLPSQAFSAQVATATGAAADADMLPSQVFTASAAAGIGAAVNASVTTGGAATSANAITATATGVAAAAAPSIAPDADLATATGTAITATTHETQPVTANVATASGAAVAATAKVGATSQLASATGTALPVTSKVTVNVSVATATGAALVADGLPGTRALANVATATGTALVADGLPGEIAPAGVGAATGAALDIDAAIKVNAGSAAATGVAANATVSTTSTGQVTGQTALASGTAQGITAKVAPTLQVASATGAASSPDASLAPTASVAAGTGAAIGTDAKVAPRAGLAAATGTAANASVTTAAAASATAGVATATGAAHAPTVGAASSISATASAATATGAAYNARVVVAVAAAAATGTGNVHAAAIAVAVAGYAETATAMGTAYDAGVALGAAAALAQVATATGTAYNVRAQVHIGSGIESETGIRGGIVTLPGVRGGVATVPGVRGGIAAAGGPRGGIVTEPRVRGRVA